VAAMEMGAATVFEKPLDDNSFLNRLERYCFEDHQWVIKRRSCEAIQKTIARLTETERAVLDQLMQGLSNKAIARNLSKSVKAIERQRQNVVHKLDCNSVMEVLHKVQACPMQTAMPVACSRNTCPASIV